jgi:hypothetical protein
LAGDIFRLDRRIREATQRFKELDETARAAQTTTSNSVETLNTGLEQTKTIAEKIAEIFDRIGEAIPRLDGIRVPNIGGVQVPAQVSDAYRDEVRKRAELTAALDLERKEVVVIASTMQRASSATERFRDAMQGVAGAVLSEFRYLAYAAGNLAGRLANARSPQDVGLAVLAEVLEPMLRRLAPAFEALMLPLAMFGQTLGVLIIPMLRLLWGPMKMLGIALTYVVEGFARMMRALTNGIGTFIRGLGRAIDKIPGISGGPLIRAGQNLLDFSDSMRDAARQAADDRRRLVGMGFNDAMDSATSAAQRFAEAISNMPQLFELSARRWQASQGGGVATPGAAGGSTQGGTRGARGPVTLTVNVNNPGAGVDAGRVRAEVAAGLVQVLRAAGMGDSDIALAFERAR